MLGCEPGVAAITREKGAADVTAWGAHRPDHRPHQDGDDDGSDQYRTTNQQLQTWAGGEEWEGSETWKKLVGSHKNIFFLQKPKTQAFTHHPVRSPPFFWRTTSWHKI